MVHENLKKIRTAMGVTQSHLAKKINVTGMTYSRIENGESKLDVERLKVISRTLGIDISVFFDEKLTKSVIESIDKAHYHDKQLA
ncbi:helix-turn-helix transcriptional regulator [Solibacillus sp. FSL W8-0372]|uniref:helix-turn-helix domain-containing protein n=1 Tax=Solibacillus sp. FSL W8-0372 TaxID=2921713 RepID=UPI0030D5B460